MSTPDLCQCCLTVKSEPEPERLNTMAETVYEQAIIKVFWDIHSCPIPRGYKADVFVQKLESALRKLNYRGEISITAYGNLNHISPSVKQTLASSGVVLEHVNYRAMRNLLSARMMGCLLGRHKAPVNVMLISREEAYYRVLEFVQEHGSNTLLAHPPYPSQALLDSAKTSWLLRKILEDEPDT